MTHRKQLSLPMIMTVLGQFVLDAEQRQDSVGHLISILMI